MTVVPHWFLPTSGDGRTVVERFPMEQAADALWPDLLLEEARPADEIYPVHS